MRIAIAEPKMPIHGTNTRLSPMLSSAAAPAATAIERVLCISNSSRLLEPLDATQPADRATTNTTKVELSSSKLAGATTLSTTGAEKLTPRTVGISSRYRSIRARWATTHR
ncbi:MAG TPA: hypothetical protein VF635_15215 [Propionibacteriaceae bacterium]